MAVYRIAHAQVNYSKRKNNIPMLSHSNYRSNPVDSFMHYIKPHVTNNQVLYLSSQKHRMFYQNHHLHSVKIVYG